MPTIQETLKSTEDLLKRIPQEGVDNQPIPIDTLNKTYKAIGLPTLPADDTNYPGLISSNVNFLDTKTDLSEEPTWLKKYLGGIEKPVNPADTYKSLYGEAGIEAKEADVLEKQKTVKSAQGELNLISAQLKGITDEAIAQNLALEQQGAAITTGGLARSQQANIREKAIQALPFQAAALVAQAKIASAQGDQELSQQVLSLAQEKLTTAFNLQNQYEERLYNYNKDLRDKVWDYATDKEKVKLQQMQKEDDRDFTLMVNNLNQGQTLSNTAIANGDANTASRILALDPKSATYTTDLATLAGQIKPKPEKTPAPTIIKSGNLILPESAIAGGQQQLNISRGQPYKNEKGETITPTGVDAEYVNSKLYLEMLEAWMKDGGLQQDFFFQYPPKNYLNPKDASIPTYIRDKLKTSEEIFNPFK